MPDLTRRESSVVWILGIPAFAGVSILMLYMLDAADVTVRNPFSWLFTIGFGYFWWRAYRQGRTDGQNPPPLSRIRK
ncbi:MAG TPA: hypothetical protein VGD94_10725 [Vicinamibacterales bacterium]